ncbi:MAG: mitochondrial carrier domain-containing protein [Benniella sp.]|nr:MAG: mitochondrial carrier domain-containing protein [Benniella sp.]
MPFSFPLGLGTPLVISALTAPLERVLLLLQTQDEIILNLREESLALDYHRHHRIQWRGISSSEPQLQLSDNDDQQNSGALGNSNNYSNNYSNSNSNNNDDNNASNDGVEYDDEEDIEPRSIIVPYAYLPYTDMKDCFKRLVEKEGHRSLWRGYPLEFARFVLQAGIELTLQQRQPFRSWLDLRGWIDVTTESYAGSMAWILGATIQGVLRSTIALGVVYPLATLQTKMITDVIRKTKKPSIATTMATSVVTQDQQETLEHSRDPATAIADAPEWIEHDDGQEEMGHLGEVESGVTTASKAVASSPLSIQAPEYELSYKYQDVRDALRVSIDSCGGFIGLYKGFSTVLATTFVSHFGLLMLYRTIPSRTGLGAILFTFGATSIMNLILYPVGTVCRRRMIAAPGRYSSSWDVAKHIVEKHGWMSLFKGCEVAMVRNAVTLALGWIIY